MPFYRESDEYVGDQEKLASYCRDNGIYVGHKISRLVRAELIKLGVLKK